MSGEVSIVPRSVWGAQTTPCHQAPAHAQPLPVDSVVLAFNTEAEVCSDSQSCVLAMRDLQMRHLFKGENDICYNFVVCGDGKVYEGRGWNTRHSATLKYPDYYFQTLTIGMFGGRKRDPEGGWTAEPALADTAIKFINWGHQNNYIKDLTSVYEDHENVI